MNDYYNTITNSALDKLPLFASDLEIAVAIVGKQNASSWKREMIPALERKGFPRFDPVHKGRAVPLVRKFYEAYFGLTMGAGPLQPDGKERLGQYSRRKRPEDEGVAEERAKEEERRARAKANSDAWAEKKRMALEDYRAKKAAEADSKLEKPD